MMIVKKSSVWNRVVEKVHTGFLVLMWGLALLGVPGAMIHAIIFRKRDEGSNEGRFISGMTISIRYGIGTIVLSVMIWLLAK
jgi:hypothetical protein